jgi:hypothetical protein
MEFVLIENYCGTFYFSVIEAKNSEDAYKRSETIALSSGFRYLVPFNHLKDFVLNYVKARKSMKGGGKIRKKK